MLDFDRLFMVKLHRVISLGLLWSMGGSSPTKWFEHNRDVILSSKMKIYGYCNFILADDCIFALKMIKALSTKVIYKLAIIILEGLSCNIWGIQRFHVICNIAMGRIHWPFFGYNSRLVKRKLGNSLRLS